MSNARTARGAVAWSVSLASVPFVAVPGYLVFGRSKFAGMRAAYEQRKQEIDALVGQVRIERAGTALAFPSQPLYLGRDRGNDSIKAKAAEASVNNWRDQESLGEASMGRMA